MELVPGGGEDLGAKQLVCLRQTISLTSDSSEIVKNLSETLNYVLHILYISVGTYTPPPFSLKWTASRLRHSAATLCDGS